MIGILTLHNATNYGAVLQTYALQHKLDMLGVKNEVIPYECQKVTNSHRIVFKWWNPLGYVLKKRTKKRFRDFLENRVRVGSKIPFTNQNSPYDTFLVGSDQVWNLDLTGDDLIYFLKSIPKNTLKYSYAASMGSYGFSDNKLQTECITLLNDFSTISVREKTTMEYLNSCANFNIYHREIGIHPDPVLLLGKKEWSQFLTKKQKNGYILLYMIWRQPELIQKAQEVSRLLKLPVLWITDSLRHYHGIKNRRGCGPEEFVNMFSNSTYIITNSFHGTTFAIIFHKPFFTVTYRNQNRVERIADLLEDTGLECCSIKSDPSVETLNNISWNEVDKKLHIMVLKAEEYLKRIATPTNTKEKT